jgi:hypothetical protein
VEGLKARRGDLSGPVLAILVTLVLLAIGAAIVAYFVLLGGAPQQAVIAVVGQPTIVKGSGNNFIANITIKNVGSTNITLTTTNVRLNITGTVVTPNYISRTSLTPGATATIGFYVTNRWPLVASKETVSGVLTIRDVMAMEVVFRVVKPS